MNKRFNTETTADDLLMLPDIDGIVKDIRGQKTISGQSKTDVKTEQPEEAPAETDNTSSEGGSSWEVFLRCSQSYDYSLLKVEAAGRCSSDAARAMTTG